MAQTLAPVTDITPQPAPLSPFGAYSARSLATSAHAFGVDAEGIRDLFAGCEEAGYGFPSEYEAAVMAELAAMAAGVT